MLNNMKKNKIIYLILVVILLIGLVYLSKEEKIENKIKEITTNIKTILINNDIKNYNGINYNIDNELKKEIEELKNLLDIKNTFLDYKIINSTVILRNKSYYLSTLEIDKGKKDGIKKNMAVVTQEGLIGKISKVYKNSSEVKLITQSSNKYKTSIIIKLNNKDYLGIINGYKDGLIKVENIDKNIEIKNNEIVVTSGMEKGIPRGIVIGSIEKEENSKYDLSKTIYIKSNVDFNNIHYVSIIGDKNE